MTGVMCFRNQKAILRFLAPFRRSLLLSLRVALCCCILFRLLSRLSSISNDSVIILFTSTSSWFSLFRFSYAFWSLNSFFFFKMTRSKGDKLVKIWLESVGEVTYQSGGKRIFVRSSRSLRGSRYCSQYRTCSSVRPRRQMPPLEGTRRRASCCMIFQRWSSRRCPRV